MSLSLIGVDSWREVLLEDPGAPRLAAVLPPFLKWQAAEFLKDCTPVGRAIASDLDRWYGSSDGQAALCAFTRALWDQMADFAPHAMPAHDARHAMFKVPAASLEYVAAENLHGWERVGVLGALLHDHGRWAEERIFGFPGPSVLHARLSFLLGEELLRRFDMPAPVKQQILLAALRHTTGADPCDPLPLQLTVSADRDQLYGPEIVLRIAHHAVGADGAGSSFYGEKQGKPVLDQLERYLTHRLPGPLFSRQAHVARAWTILAKFLMLAEETLASRTRFARISAQLRPEHPETDRFDWEREFAALPRAAAPPEVSVAFGSLLEAPHVAPGPLYRQQAFDKLQGLSTANATRLAHAFCFVDSERRALDAEQHQALSAIARHPHSDPLLGTLCGLLLCQWEASAVLPAARSSSSQLPECNRAADIGR